MQLFRLLYTETFNTTGILHNSIFLYPTNQKHTTPYVRPYEHLIKSLILNIPDFQNHDQALSKTAPYLR